MNDWKDKFHFYVSVEKPSEVKQSFDLYFFLDNLKTNKKQNKLNIHKKNFFKTLSRKKLLALEEVVICP